VPAASTPAVAAPAGGPDTGAGQDTPPELRPAGPAGRTLTSAQVRERLVRTKQKLDSIDKRRLNAGKRAEYDSAQRFRVHDMQFEQTSRLNPSYRNVNCGVS
jgi:hypothetical protein